MNAVNMKNIFSEAGAVRLDTSRQDALSGLKIGDIVSGTLVENNGKKAAIAMDNGKSFSVDAQSIVAEIGRKISFEVADVHGNSIVMKQIHEKEEEETKESESADLTGEKLLNWAKGAVLPITGAAFQSSRIMAEQSAERDAALFAALNKIKRDIIYSINNAGGGVLSILTSNGISIDSVTVSMLSAAIKSAAATMSGTGEPSQEELTAAVESYSRKDSTAEYENILDSVAALLEEDMPPTEANIDALLGVREKAEEAGRMSREDRVSFLKTQNGTTLGNLFTSLHSAGRRQPANEASDAEWDEIRNSLERYMTSAGIPKSGDALDAARTLIANDIPVTKENIDFLNNTLKQRKTSDIIRSAARNMAEGKPSLDVDFYEHGAAPVIDRRELLGRYEAIIKGLPAVTDDALASVIDSGGRVTVASILEAQRSLREGGGNNPSRENGSGRQNTIFIAEKIKLEEIRLRLTITAASQMARAGVSIDTLELQAAIDELKLLERKNNEAALNIAGVEPSGENIAEMSARSQKIRGLSNTYDSVKRAVMNREIEFTAERLMEANERLREKAAGESYKAAETAPSAKFGDSISKVLNQIESLLLSLGIEANPENIKAAKSLLRTGTDTTRENIEAIKAINNKIDFVSSNLHPVISASMIKDGFNPLSAHIDEVSAYIERYNEIYGEPPVEAMEKAIFYMDKKGFLSKAERDSLIGTYRMLSEICKNEAASAAIIAKSGKSLTLENLMEAGKYYDKSRSRRSIINRIADDSEGVREVAAAQNSIREQLGRAYHDAVRSLEESGVDSQKAVETAIENNLGPTAQNMELIMSVLDSGMELSGLNLNMAGNIKHNITRLLDAVGKGRGAEFLKSLGDGAQKTDVRELLEQMEEFMEANSQNEARLYMSEEAAFSAFKEDLKSVAGVTPQQLAWMMAMNLPLTIGNLKTVKGMAADKGYIGKRIEELNRLAENIAEAKLDDELPGTDLKRLIEAGDAAPILEDINGKAKEILEKAMGSDSPRKVELMRQASIIENAAKVMRETGERYYQLPVKLNDKIGSLNVYVLNKNAESGNMSGFIQLDMTELGTIQASVNIADGIADIVIGAESPESARLLEHNAGILREYFSDMGLLNYNLSFRTERSTDFLGGADIPHANGERQPVSPETGLDITV